MPTGAKGPAIAAALPPWQSATPSAVPATGTSGGTPVASSAVAASASLFASTSRAPALAALAALDDALAAAVPPWV